MLRVRVCVRVMLACREFSIYLPPSSISFPSSLHGRVWMCDVEYGNSGAIQLNIPASACVSRNKKERNKRTKHLGYASAEFAYIFYESIRNIKNSPNTHLIKFRLVGGTIEIISNEKTEWIHSSVSSVEHRAHDRAGPSQKSQILPKRMSVANIGIQNPPAKKLPIK